MADGRCLVRDTLFREGLKSACTDHDKWDVGGNDGGWDESWAGDWDGADWQSNQPCRDFIKGAWAVWIDGCTAQHSTVAAQSPHGHCTRS